MLKKFEIVIELYSEMNSQVRKFIIAPRSLAMQCDIEIQVKTFKNKVNNIISMNLNSLKYLEVLPYIGSPSLSSLGGPSVKYESVIIPVAVLANSYIVIYAIELE